MGSQFRAWPIEHQCVLWGWAGLGMGKVRGRRDQCSRPCTREHRPPGCAEVGD